VRGTQIKLDKGWLRISECFLPLRLDGVPVLRPCGPGTYMVDNSRLKSEGAGLSFRRSPSMEDKDGNACALWGCIVRGYPANKDWLRIPECFLPMWLDGVPVLRMLSSSAEAPQGRAANNAGRLSPSPRGEAQPAAFEEWKHIEVCELPRLNLSPREFSMPSKKSLRRICSDNCIMASGTGSWASPTHNSTYKMTWLGWPYPPVGREKDPGGSWTRHD